MFKTLAKLYPLVPAAVGCSLAFSRSVDLKGITAPSPCARRGATPNPNSGRIADLGHLHARASWASQSRSPSSPSSASGASSRASRPLSASASGSAGGITGDGDRIRVDLLGRTGVASRVDGFGGEVHSSL